ncbi:MAG: hypothetical protein AAF587_23520 [Bacteroidota bacterium]
MSPACGRARGWKIIAKYKYVPLFNSCPSLAATMFADIVGYTAMMQRNEQEGLAKVRRFSELVEHQGEYPTCLW